MFQDGAYAQESDMDGLGLCPYDPRHNSTAVFVGELESNISSYLFAAKYRVKMSARMKCDKWLRKILVVLLSSNGIYFTDLPT